MAPFGLLLILATAPKVATIMNPKISVPHPDKDPVWMTWKSRQLQPMGEHKNATLEARRIEGGGGRIFQVSIRENCF